MTGLIKLLRDRHGATAVEYALVASLISVAGITAFETLGGKVENKYDRVENKL